MAAEAQEIAERWRAIGGTTEMPAGQKGSKKMIFVSPDGEKLDSVEKASDFLKERNGKPNAQVAAEDAKRAAEQPADEMADEEGNKENSKKLKKARVEQASITAAATAAPATGDIAAATDAASAAAVGSGRRAAQGDKSYKEPALPRGGRAGKVDMVVKVEQRIVASEAAALEETNGSTATPAGQVARRRLFDFLVVDEAGQVQPLERLDLTSAKLKINGIVQPAEREATRETGRKVEGLGPITDWSIRYSRSEAQIVVHTASAQYAVGRPATTYRKLFTQLEEQVTICHQVFLCLSPECGGSLQSSVDEVAAKLARAKVGKNYANAREALLLNAKFVLKQLELMGAPASGAKAGAAKAKANTAFTSSAFGVALAAEVANGPVNVSLLSNGIHIVEPQAPSGTAPDSLVEADEDMARRLQAKLDAEQYAGSGGRARGGAGGRGRGGSSGGAAYIRISEEEIADDYPAPLPYDKTEEETDELVLADDEAMLAPEDLPRRLLHDFAIYNSEGLFASLELLPMWAGADSDVELFASGVVTEDEGDWATGGQAANSAVDTAADGSSAGAGGSSASAKAGVAPPAPSVPSGMRMYLSQIREWVVEFSCDLIFISCRTDVAWYRLVAPVAKYGPWFRTVLKSAQVAVTIIGMLSEESRASRLSFNDIVKRLVEETVEKTTAFISKKAELVERFIVVHGQIILNQIANFPNKSVQRSAFVGMLRQKMESRRHCKLYMSKAKPVKGVKAQNANPMKNRAATGRPRPMNATATTMVKAVWQSYFLIGQKVDGDRHEAAAAPVAQEVEDDENAEEDDNDAVENALAVAPIEAPSSLGQKAGKKAGRKPSAKVQWVGSSTSTDAAGRALYDRAKLAGGDNTEVALGDVLALDFDEDVLADHAAAAAAAATVENGAAAAALPHATPVRPLGLVQCLYQDAAGDKMVQVRRLFRGPETVLGDAGNDFELYCTNEYETRLLSEVSGKVSAQRMTRPWGAAHRLDAFKEDSARRARNDARRAEGSLVSAEYVYRMLYRPEAGIFSVLDDTSIVTGAFREEPAAPQALGITASGGLIKAGVTYEVGDFLFLHREAWSMGQVRSGGKGKKDDSDDGDGSEEAETDEDEEASLSVPAYAAKSGRHKGSNRGLKAFKIGQLLSVASRGKDHQPATITVRPFLRPEECSADLAYRSAWWEVYAPVAGSVAWEKGLAEIEVADVVSKCSLVLPGSPGSRLAVNPRQTGLALSTFVVTHSVDPASPASSLTDAPKSLKVEPAPTAAAIGGTKAAAKSKKGKAATAVAAQHAEMTDVAAGKKKSKGEACATASVATCMNEDEEEEEEPSVVAMKTMDIFAGCGGLSEGMHQAGVADSKWAIEYEQPAADAFQLNNPDTKVFCNNCNVLLQAAMAKAGLSSDCDASEDAVEAAECLSADDVAALPLPGDVEFIMGGPPCQGYSGMNRFNKGNWSMVQNSMVMAFLSYCDFYRPRYFLLENVRNFVSHNKSFTFRLTLRTLLEMGYQVRFGVLNAGNFGVPQSRKRTIIWAAAPGESLPEWPTPRHVFLSPQLKINLPNGVQYCAVPDLPGAPLRAVTVQDAIADLPPIENGHVKDDQPYVSAAVSAFQRFIRGSSTVLHDHICKVMNELNLERCRCIPKNVPGADWRVLQEIVAADPSREKYKGQPLVPWCLPNTADRHNGWRGLFGRLDLAGHFPTSTTDPQPMGKVGQVFHPTQDRIVSVRECARAQGFPDHFRFSGNVHNRHRQVGNAVPPPLAAALGGQLRVVLDRQREEQVARLMAE